MDKIIEYTYSPPDYTSDRWVCGTILFFVILLYLGVSWAVRRNTAR